MAATDASRCCWKTAIRLEISCSTVLDSASAAGAATDEATGAAATGAGAAAAATAGLAAFFGATAGVATASTGTSDFF